MKKRFRSLSYLVCVCALTQLVYAQKTGQVRGRVVFRANSDPVAGAVVRIVRLGIVTETGVSGNFSLAGIPVGSYRIQAHREELSAQHRSVVVRAGETTKIDFELELAPLQERITVTTGESTTFDVISPVTTVESHELTADISPTLGEVLEDQAGISKRYFGPGSARPIIRGFDGDRVLIMEDGVRTGDISSQSGAHGISVDPASYERIEIVRGPATLLYGTNALGGVVNLISPQDRFHQSAPDGLGGTVTFDTGSANSQAGIMTNLRYGENGWVVWGGGTARRTDDYDTPEGPVENSQTRTTNGRAGFGYFGDRTSISLGYSFDAGRFGVPFAGEFHGHEEEGHDEEDPLFIDLDQRRQVLRFDLGLKNLSNRLIRGARLVLGYIDWQHDEFEIAHRTEELATSFDNRSFIVRAEMEHEPVGGLSGKFGFWTQIRDYETAGVEALAPPTTQDAFAAFTYQELRLGPSTRLEFGGRLEHNKYDPASSGFSTPSQAHEQEGGHGHEEEELQPPEARPRSFTGVSGSVGMRHEISESVAFVTKFSRSYRAPALEELYNFGPHVDNLAFEVGDPDLERESALGWDASLKLDSGRAQGSFNFFLYGIDNFIFPGFTDQLQRGLLVASFQQGDSQFAGFDTEGGFRLHQHLWLRGGIGFVRAELADTGEPLPRIPPLHGFVKLGIPYLGWTVAPELRWADSQHKIFRNETSTAGYAVVNLNASYVLPRSNLQHVFAVKAYNLTDRLYRNHTSLIKDLAPEIGRGIKFSYSVHFF